MAVVPLTTVEVIPSDSGNDTPARQKDAVAIIATLSLVQLILPLFVPRFIVAASTLILEPVLPEFALSELSSSTAGVGVALAAIGVGRVISCVPSGSFVRRYGAKVGMLTGLLLDVIAALVGAVSPVLGLLVASRFLHGTAQALIEVSQQVFISERVATDKRGRTSSLFGGIKRIASFLAPLAGGFIATQLSLRAVFVAQGAIIAVCAVCVAAFMPRKSSKEPAMHEGKSSFAAFRVLREHRRVFLVVGAFCALFMSVRQARPLVFPLASQDLGLTIAELGAVLSLGYLFDSSLFWMSGLIMDKVGRKVNAAVSALIMGIGFSIVGIAADRLLFTVGVCVVGLGNSLSAGLIFTMGSDLAPKSDDRATFIGLYRLVVDVGQFVGPLCTALIAESFTVRIAAFSVTGIAAVTILWLWVAVPETLHRRNKVAVDPEQQGSENTASTDVQ